MNVVEMKNSTAAVPCGICRACCVRDRIVLRDDEADRFKWHFEGAQKVLDRKSDGMCVYLTERGCSIHVDAPDICRRFDCRVLFLATPKATRRRRVQENPTMRAVYSAGRRRLDTLQVIK